MLWRRGFGFGGGGGGGGGVAGTRCVGCNGDRFALAGGGGWV